MIKLWHGDCLDKLKNIPSESIDLICTDPPYPVTSRGNHGTSGGMLRTELSLKGKIFEHNDIDPTSYAPEFYRVLKDGTHCYVMCNHVNLQHMLNVFTDCGFKFTKSLIWDKGNKIMGTFYMSQFEYILFFRKGKGKKINNCGTSDIISIPNKKTKEGGKNVHDTEKPVSLMQLLIENSTSEREVVLDPFMGIGSTGAACVNSNRSFIGIELDDKYFSYAKARIKDAVQNKTMGTSD